MSEKNKIKVMVVDDHPLVRHGIKTVFEAYGDILLVAEAENGKEAIEMYEKYRPDIVLMDMIMPILDGVEATSRLVKMWPDIKVIALTSFNDIDLIKKSLKAGAISYILKNISGAKLVKTIKDVHRGKFVLSSHATKILLSELREADSEKIKLTGREKEILAFIVEGLSNKEISKRLFLSNSTVQFHVSNILSKLGVSKRTEAVCLALKQKLVKLPG
jgi:Response regulator containing a CheY-like receiver domain and an HTH DNA-binding domain